MEKENNVQSTMLGEMRDKTLFNKAQQYAYNYMDSIFDRNVFPTSEALKNLEYFEEELPDNPSNAEEVIDLLDKYGSPATVARLGGRYFGFVMGSAVPVGLAAKNLATYWEQTGALQVAAPVTSKLEAVVEKWLVQLFGLPHETVAGFVTGTSAATFCGLAAARYRLLINMGWDVNEKGLYNAPQLRIVTGRDAHSTVLKAIAMLGFGKDKIEWVDVDEQGRIIPEQIPEPDERTILILQAGNVNSGAFDPFAKIWEKAKKSGAWIHIDGAFGLWAAAVDELKYLTKGIEYANSWAVDGHKTLNTPYDCGIALCNDKEALVSALHMTGSYIIHGKERDGMYYTPDMSQRARAIELWAIIRYLGRKGIDQMIHGMHHRAVQFADALRKSEGFQVLNDVVFNQVIVQCETDEVTERVISKIQDLRECWVGGATWRGKKVIRISVCSWATTEEDVTRSVNSFREALAVVKKESIRLEYE